MGVKRASPPAVPSTGSRAARTVAVLLVFLFLSVSVVSVSAQDKPPDQPKKDEQTKPKPPDEPKKDEQPQANPPAQPKENEQPQPNPADRKPPSFMYRSGHIEVGDKVSIFYRVSPSRGEPLKKLLEKWITSEGRVDWEKELHMFVVTDKKENIDLMEKLVEVLETPEPQVMIEAQIVEVTMDSDLQLGLEGEWNRPGTNKAFVRDVEQTFNPTAYLQSLFPGSLPYQGSYFRVYTDGDSRGTLDLRVRSLIERGKAKILSQPRVLVASGQTATIMSGQKVPLATVTTQNNVVSVSVMLQDVNITLTVTPIVIGKDYIQMVIEPQVQAVSGYSQVQGISTPLISTRRAKTEVVIRDEQQISIGGLMREETVETTRGIPLLCDIPLIGYLFESQRHEYHKTDILFQIRPIINQESSEQPARMIVPPGLSGGDDGK